MPVQPVPPGFHTITPYVLVAGVPKFIDFLVRAFGAEETHRTALPDGTVMHAQVRIGDSMMMMGDPTGWGQPSPAGIYLYVPDVDAVYRQAVAAGAASMMAPSDQFYGDRSAGVKDPFGNTWWIGTHKEDVPADELARRAADMCRQRDASKK